MSQREAILAACENVVALPTCVRKAGALLDDPNADIPRLGRLIEHDPGLTANLLKVVNSSAIAQNAPMVTAKDALAWLQSPEIFRFVISTGVAPTYLNEVEGYDQAPSMFLQHSTTVGLASVELARALGLEPPKHTFTAGLLSGVGKLLLGTHVKVDMREILYLVFDKNMPFDRAEEAAFGINHAELGGLLLARWGLPSTLTDVVKYHLRPDEFDGEDLALDLVHVGNVLAKTIGVGLGADGLNYEVSNDVVARLGITAAVLDRASVNVVVELQSLWDLFIECVGEDDSF